MLESIETMRADLDAEKRAMQRILAKRQSQIERLTGLDGQFHHCSFPCTQLVREMVSLARFVDSVTEVAIAEVWRAGATDGVAQSTFKRT